MDTIISYLSSLNNIEILLFAGLLISLFIQLFYYCFYYKRPLSYLKKQSNKNTSTNKPGVSVIIVAKDSSIQLSRNLPVILNQTYPNYEVIIVNIGFTEETNNIIQDLKLKYSNLYDTFLPEEPLEGSTDRKKLGLTIGIKAAKNDILLFTEADTLPDSEKWIDSMISNMTETKDIVIGYCYYNKSNKFFNRVSRFDNLFYSMQYLSSAINSKPYTGIYRNLAFRKALFFNNKGFSSSLNYKHSEAIFLNRIMESDNVAVSINEDSFVSTDINSFNKWKNIKICSYNIKKHFSMFRFSSRKFGMETISRYLFYILSILLLSYSIIIEDWILSTASFLIFTIRLFCALRIIHKSSKHFKAGRFHFSFIIMDIIQPIYNLAFRLSSTKTKSGL